MINENNNEAFNYTYSAKQQDEIKAIREKYVASEETEDKVELLYRLDNKVTQKATMTSLVIGIIGALILGLGMSLIMTEISAVLKMNHTLAMILGIIIGLVGVCFVGAAYPAYNQTIKKEREKIAPEIIRLTDELMK